MASSIGIDFGSTFSLFSHYHEVQGRVKGINTEDGSCYVPSVACEGDYGLVTGEEAKYELITTPSLVPYRAFKMLLHEMKPEKYREHGYLERTPEEVSRSFLDKYLNIAASECGVQQFDNAVVCVPAHWAKNCAQMGGRAMLLKICREIEKDGKPILNNLRVVSEPIAATAYYAYHYWKSHDRQPFTGKVIVVDYGGGTLDVTLTTVTAEAGSKDSSTMEIDVNHQTGGGQNHPGQIGDAGLAYMEKVAAMALQEAGVPNVKMDGHFLQVKDRLEAALIRRTDEIENRIQQNYPYDLDEMAEDTEVFTMIKYKRKYDLKITYSLLYRVFENVIYPVLKKYLEEIKDFLRESGFSIDDVQIAVVGGFGQYPLVQHTVWKLFDSTDTARDITLSVESDAADSEDSSLGTRGDRRDAISFGAALIAAGKITVPVRSHYAIGLRYRVSEEVKTFRTAIHYGEQIRDCSTIYPLGHKMNGDVRDDVWEPIVYNDTSENPWVFAVNVKNDPTWAIELTPLPEVLRDIRNRVRRATNILETKLKAQNGRSLGISSYYFGFSMDESEIYHLHIIPAHPETDERLDEYEIEVELGNFAYLFGPLVSFVPRADNENVLRCEL